MNTPTKFRLFKRAETGRELATDSPAFRERPYYFKFTHRGRRYVRCLETPDAAEAQRRARLRAQEIRAAITRDDYAALGRTKQRGTPIGTLAELEAAYLGAPVDAEPKTRRQNILALRQLLGVSSSPASCLLSSISSSAARAWFTTASAKAQALEDQAEKARLKRSANSRFVQAKSLFVPKAVALYKELGLWHPGLDAFANAGCVFKFTKLPASSYCPPADAIITATLQAWEQVTDRNLFLAIGHMLAFGLRISELAQAKWSWWTTRQGYPVLEGETPVKNGTGLLQVRALDPWFTILKHRIHREGWQGRAGSPLPAASDYILTGTATDRTDNTFRAVSTWLRALGWETQKTNHELRKYAGSQIAMKYGIYEAQCWLRHSTVKVTEQHYAGYVKRFKPADLDALPARWATLEHLPPQLTLLPAAG